MLDKDQQIERLQQEVNKLRGAFLNIDLAVDRASAKYLRPIVEHGKLKFVDFLDLLVAEIQRKTKEDLKGEQALAKLLTKEVERRIEAKILELVPAIKGKLSDYLVLPILVIAEKKLLVQDRFATNYKTVSRAISIRGHFKLFDGASPEEAYAELREHIAVKLFKIGQQELVASLAAKDIELTNRFKQAAPFKTDEIEGFKIEARII